ncbi:hypothetical protein FPY71_18305 [Aureimonas fodinaquatilis]|uniref:MAPEG family protein n=1 Tax=Aureimonas fodinaquatilis TaxID=2565783 RepID=A0A5B0DQM4_9HYPH|nr:MAPEG family protein [Aureimonas fodinaquatilis]KAA0968275.1 hypothetical protein FPY71_18305 [Aureimonas fodinaquatilis]
MNAETSLPTELVILGLSVLLLFLHIMLQGQFATKERGFKWNAGPRDESKPLGIMAGRADRALRNFQETYPAFVALALGLAVTGQTGGLGAVGALLWIVARCVYLPLYLMGTPVIRSIVFGVSFFGLTLMLVRFF